MSSRRRHVPLPLYHPRLWPAWLLWGMAWLLAQLPLRALTPLGRGVGWLFWMLARRRRDIARTNLALCLPEQSAGEREDIARRSMVNLGVTAVENLWSWLGNGWQARSHQARFDVRGLEHYTAAVARGRGVILLGAHLMTMDVIGARLKGLIELDVIYRYSKNPLVERTMLHGRQRFFPQVIEREDTRAMLRALRAGRTLWYAADQDYGPRHSVFAPFFGVDAATITGTARLARFNDSPVLLLSHYRHPRKGTWSIHFSPPLEGFPSGDPVADASRSNAMIEAAIRQAPEQYLWIHRRFKTRPDGTPKRYA